MKGWAVAQQVLELCPTVAVSGAGSTRKPMNMTNPVHYGDV